jgi:hypothetical protein
MGQDHIAWPLGAWELAVAEWGVRGGDGVLTTGEVGW